MLKVCYTIGHSNLELEVFISLLSDRGVDCVADVRSAPSSGYCPYFNKEPLKLSLNESGIQYVFLGNVLGGRAKDQTLLTDGVVDYLKVQESPTFKEGIKRVLEGLDKGYKLCLMCAEKDPFDCHRFLLVSTALAQNNVTVNHILPDGSMVSQKELNQRLLDRYKEKNSQRDMFETSSNMSIDRAAYIQRNLEIAYEYTADE